VNSIRRLVVVRHSKAEQFAPSDLERVLSPRGRADGKVLGEWLAGQGVVPGTAYVSYAARTRETWQVVAEGAGWELEPHIDGSLYGTDEFGVLELVHTTPEDVETVVVVGHNPTMEMLAQQLDDGEGTATGSVEMGTFPTSTAAVFEVDGQWSDMAPMRARLQAFHVGRAAE
jgi:phosphohistidine phosphatase